MQVPLPRRRTRSYHESVPPIGPCPANVEEVAEAYVMGTLPEEQRSVFEEHYLACAACTTVLERVAAYIDAMQAAARKLRPEPDQHD